MGISRVQKFKDYRNSLIKAEAPVLETPKSSPKTETKISQKETTSTLPMDQVIETLQNEETEAIFLKKAKRNKILFIVAIATLSLIIVAGIIVFGILVWK